MKRMIAGLAILTSLSFVAAEAQVSSRNAAGYVKINIERGKLDLLANPFNTFTGDPHTLSGMLGTDNLPVGTIASVWDAAQQKYVSSTLQSGGFGGARAWNPNQNVDRADGFFVQITSNPQLATEPNYDVYLFGEVPDRFTANDDSPIELETGLTSFGFAYPVTVKLKDTALWTDADVGDIISFWNANTGYESITYQSLGFGGARQWQDRGGDGVDDILEPGRGYFYRTNTAKTWTEAKPYDWP